MKYNKFSRRFFLQGVGGSLMTLPILPSVVPVAHADVLPNDKFLVMFGSDHGGVGSNGTNWFPELSLNPDHPLMQRHTLFPVGGGGASNLDHVIRHARLRDLQTTDLSHPGGNVDGGQRRTSFVLGSFFNAYTDKMNLYRGIDAGTFYSGHNRGIYTGNIAQAVNNPEARGRMENWPSLNEFLGNSSKFYPNLASISVKSIVSDRFTYDASGAQVPGTPGGGRIDSLYSTLFSKFDQTITPAERARRVKKDYLVDRVYEDYKRFLRGAHGPARRISSEDKQRVERHVANLFDIQNKYKNIANSCGNVLGPKNRVSLNYRLLPNGVADLPMAYDLYTDLIASAFNCGSSRLAAMALPVNYNETGRYSGSYHQEVAHQGGDPVKALRHAQSFRWSARHIVAPLVRKLDSLSANGQTGSILDNGLVMWTHEASTRATHQKEDIGFVTFGGLGGFFKTGNFIDFRNLKNHGLRRSADSNVRPGLPIQGVWANIIQGFGYTKAEYERNGRAGYSDTTENTQNPSSRYKDGHHPYATRIMNSLSDRLPIIT